MKRIFISRLLLLVVLSTLIYSCVHEEISSSSDLSTKQYNSKSVWKEDETYIKNVMEIYNKHEAEIKKGNGTPLWDYAMTMGYMDESFLIVPVASGKTIVSCIQVPRNGDQIKFVYDNQEEHLRFFQKYTTSEKRKPLDQTKPQTSTVAKPVLCAVTSVSMWYPDSSSPGGGYWETQYITTCTHNPGGSGCNGYYDSQGNCMPSGYEPPVYPYPGGGGGNQPQPPQDPCAKTKTTLQRPEIKEKINNLYAQSKLSGEKAFMATLDGTPGPIIQGDEHSANLGDITGYSGYSHNHTPKGIKMLSNRDIYKLFAFIVNQPPGTPVDAAFAGMVGTQACASGCADGYEYFNYIIRFNGTGQEAGNIYTKNYDFKALGDKFEEFEQKLRPKAEYASQNGNYMNSKGLEEVFFNALEKMGIDKSKMTLQRIDKNGNVNNVTIGADGKPTDNPCPN